MPDSRELQDLHPHYQPIVAEVLGRAWRSRRIYPFIISGRRPAALQACLYAQGRVHPGGSATYGEYTVVVSKHGNTVTARCRNERVDVPAAEWQKTVTKALPHQTWHVYGLAVDIAFRSSATSRDVRYDLWMYRELAKIFREVCPEVRWGRDWDGDGIEVGADPDEGKFADSPHFEWHPGITLGEVASGVLPELPKQCRECRNFRDHFPGGERCADCSRRGPAPAVAAAA